MEKKTTGKKKIVNHQDLGVYNLAFDASMTIFRLLKSFPKEEVLSERETFSD